MQEELGNIKTSLACLKLEAPAEQVQLSAKLNKLVSAERLACPVNRGMHTVCPWVWKYAIVVTEFCQLHTLGFMD